MEHLEKDNDMNDLKTEMTQEQRKIIVLKLRDLQKYWSHYPALSNPTPEWLNADDYRGWTKALAQVTRDAADLLEAYEAEVASLVGMASAPIPATYDYEVK